MISSDRAKQKSDPCPFRLPFFSFRISGQTLLSSFGRNLSRDKHIKYIRGYIAAPGTFPRGLGFNAIEHEASEKGTSACTYFEDPDSCWYELRTIIYREDNVTFGRTGERFIPNAMRELRFMPN